MRYLLVLVVLLTAAPTRAAERQNAFKIDPSKFPELVANLRIPADQIRKDITENDVTLSEDDVEVTPSRAGILDSAALSLIVDSGPAVAPVFAEVRATAQRALGALGTGPPAELVLARDPAERPVPFTRVRTRIDKVLNELKTGGSVRLSHAIRIAIKDITAVNAKSRVILILTAARDVDARGRPLPLDPDLEPAVEQARVAHVPLYFICFGADPDAARAGDLARRSGGNVLLDPSATELSELFGDQIPMVVFNFTYKAVDPAVPAGKRARKVIATLRIPGYEGEVPAYYGGNTNDPDAISGAVIKPNDRPGEALPSADPVNDPAVESTSGRPTGLTP